MNRDVAIRIQRIGPVFVPLPAYQTEGAAGMDLCAAISAPEILPPGMRALIPTGLAFAIPAGFEGQVRPRSGLALRHGVSIVNTPGTVDSDYRGEVKVVLVNLGQHSYVVEPLSRIAQMVIAPVARAAIELVEELEGTARGSGGYGSTGV